MVAFEVIREIVGFGEGLVGRLVMLDARAMRFETLRYSWDPENPLSGEHPTIRDLSEQAQIGSPPAEAATGRSDPAAGLPSAKDPARAARS
jgi:hypothetical protein